MTTEVRVKKGEVIDRALRRLKKKLDKEGTLKELRNRRHYEKPSEIKRREAKQRRHWSSQEETASRKQAVFLLSKKQIKHTGNRYFFKKRDFDQKNSLTKHKSGIY